MRKELIILSFSFDVSQMTRQSADNILHEYMKVVEDSFDDDELKENYIIKQFFLPSDKTKIECIYPTNTNMTSNIDIEEQIKRVETEILKHKNPELWEEWNTLMRWAKLKNIKEI